MNVRQAAKRRTGGVDCVALTGVATALAALLLTSCSPGGDSAGVEPDEAPGAETPVQSLFAEAEITAVGEHAVSGQIRFNQRDGLLQITGNLSGLSPGLHGLHIHEGGDCSAGAAKAGGHFSPQGHPHGSPEAQDDGHHAGDLGNVTANAEGAAKFDIVDTELQLGDHPLSVIGHAVIVHASADDLTTQPDGNAGDRIGCGVVQPMLRPTYVVE